MASAMIEGTQASLAEIFELDAARDQPNADAEQVLAYVDAMQWAVSEAPRLPLSNRMMLETHGRLLSGVRGADRRPGEFRTTQNWIGRPGSTLQTATFVPPPPDALAPALADWERFANEEPEMPLLVPDALLHAQFETIHPFLDGNGRLGRLLLVLFLIVRGRLTAPLLYLSAGIERQRDRYYAALRAARADGDALPWIELFLEAVRSQSIDAVTRAEKIIGLRERYRSQAAELGSVNALQLVDLVCDNPIVTTRLVEARLGVARPTALRLLRQLADAGLLEEGARGQRRYVARDLMDVVTADEFGRALIKALVELIDVRRCVGQRRWRVGSRGGRGARPPRRRSRPSPGRCRSVARRRAAALPWPGTGHPGAMTVEDKAHARQHAAERQYPATKPTVTSLEGEALDPRS